MDETAQNPQGQTSQTTGSPIPTPQQKPDTVVQQPGEAPQQMTSVPQMSQEAPQETTNSASFQQPEETSLPTITEVKEEKPKSEKNTITILLVILLVIVLGALVFVFLTNRRTIATLRETNQQQTTQIKQLQDENAAATTELASLKDQMESESSTSATTSYFPVQFGNGNYQKVAQVFQLAEAKSVSGVKIWASFGVGGDISLTLYELANPESVVLGTPLASATFAATSIVDENTSIEALFGQAIALNIDKAYIVVIETTDETTQTSIAFTEGDLDQTGKMWTFTRLVGGNGEILDENFSWQPKNTQDMVFEVI